MKRPRLDVERLEREHLLDLAAWRGLVVQLRGGGRTAIERQQTDDAFSMARALHAATAIGERGVAAFVHTRRCKRRDATCGCAGARLVAGARA